MRIRYSPCQGKKADCFLKWNRNNFSSTSPETEEIVKESIKNGLPIIPFAYPTFFTTYRRQEADSTMRRKNHSRCPAFNKRPPQLGYEVAADSEDEVFQMENDERCEGGESLPSLDSIVQMAKLQMEVIVNSIIIIIVICYVRTNPMSLYVKNLSHLMLKCLLIMRRLMTQRETAATISVWKREQIQSFCHRMILGKFSNKTS